MTPEVTSGLAQVKEAATFAAIVFGGFWAFWKWTFSEYLGKKSEIRCVGGDITAKVFAHNTETVVLSAEAKWRNLSKFTETIDKDRTKIEIHKISEEHPPGPVLQSSDVTEIVSRIRPFGNLERFSIGPKADYIHRFHWILERNQRFVIQWKLYSTHHKNPGEREVRTRELVVSTEVQGEGVDDPWVLSQAVTEA